jgi:hypothetical protein
MTVALDRPVPLLTAWDASPLILERPILRECGNRSATGKSPAGTVTRLRTVSANHRRHPRRMVGFDLD